MFKQLQDLLDLIWCGESDVTLEEFEKRVYDAYAGGQLIGTPVASYDVLPMHVAFFCKYPLPSKHSTEDLLNKMRQAFDRNQRIWSAIQKASG